MSLKFKLSALLLSFSIFSFAQTNVSGVINSNTTWSLANSPYIVTGNILVNTGVTLTIEAGVQIRVNSGLYITIRGTLLSIGTDIDRIVFTSNSNNPTSGDWKYIQFEDDAIDAQFDLQSNYLSGSTLQYTDILYGGEFQNWKGNGAIMVRNAAPFLDNVNISYSESSGIHYWEGNNPSSIPLFKISNSNISNNAENGIHWDIGSQNATLLIDNTTFDSNANYGIESLGSNLYFQIQNSRFLNASGFNENGSNNFVNLRKNVFDGAHILIGSGVDTCKMRCNLFLNKFGWLTVSSNAKTNQIDSNVFVNNSSTTLSLDPSGNYSNNNKVRHNHFYNNDFTLNNPNTGSNAFLVNLGTANTTNFDNNLLAKNKFYAQSIYTKKSYNRTSAQITANANNFFSNSNSYEVRNDRSHSHSDINLVGNFWNSTDSSLIAQKIYDGYDNFQNSFAPYFPFLLEPDTITPISPPTSVTKKASSGLVTLNWQPNPEADVAGYKIYWDNPTDYSYDTVVDVGNVTSFTLNGITDLSAEYAVVAYDNMADEDDMDVFEGHQSWFAVSEKFSPTINTSNFNGNNISCNGSSDGQITLSITDGTSPYAYGWSHDSTLTSNQASNLNAGTYFYSIADADGLSLTDSLVLTEPDSLLFTVSKMDILCAGLNDGSISFTTSGGTTPYQYSINGSSFSTTAVFSALSPGIYPLEVRDANNCSTYDTITLNQLGFLSLSLDSSSNLSCNGASDGSVSVTAAAGVLPYSYLWSNGDTIDDISNLAVNTYSLTVTDAVGCFQTLSHTITEPVVLSVTSSVSSFNGFEISCNGAANGSITLNTSGGTLPYSFSWAHDVNESSNSVSNLSPGTYVYTVTDDHLCELTDSIVIAEPAALSYSVSSTDILCHGANTGIIDFTLSGGVTPYQYSINNGGSFSTNPNFSSLSTGTYYTRIKDANNCFVVDTIVLTEPSALLITTDSSANLSCNGANDGFIAVSISGGVSPYTYNWNNGAFASEDISNLSANSYILTVTDSNSCSVSMSYIITEPTVLAVSNTVSDFNGYQISCNGAADGSITLNTSGGTSPYSYAWAHDLSLSSSSITNLDTGTYIYTVTDDHLCFFSDTIVITQPDSLLIQAVNVYTNNCSNGADGSLAFEVVGGTLPYSFSIFDSIGNVISNADSIGNLVHSTYSFSVSDVNGCSVSVQNIILAFDHSSIKPIITASDSVICSGTTALLSLNAGIQSVVWNDGLSGLNRNLPSGSYWVSSMDTNGCLSVSDTIVIEDLIAQDSSAQICLVTYDAVLDKNRIIFNKPDNESGISTYNIYKDVFGVWQIIGTVNNGDSSQFVDNTSQPSSRVARYYIETEDQCGITYSTINSPIHKTVLLQSSIGSNNEVNLSWNQYEGASIWYYRILRSSTGVGFTAIDSVGSSFNTFIDNNPPTGNTSYFIEAVLTSGCTVKAKNKTYASLSTNSVTESTIGLTENLLADFNIYPNPTNGVLNIEYLAGKELKSIRLFDSQGKLIQLLRSDNESVQLDLSELPKGVYYLKINMDKGVITESIIRY